MAASLTVKLIGQHQQFVQSMSAASKSIAGVQKSMRSITSTMQTLGVALAGLGAAAGLKRVVDDLDKIGKLSTRLGASTEALSELRHAAELSGLSFETMTMAMQRSTRRIAEAANGTGEARAALEELGLSAQRLNNMRPEQQLEVLADALSGVGNEADQVRLAMKLFDSEGVAMLQMLKSGSAGMREMRDEARSLGLTVTNEMAASAADANDALTRLDATLDGMGQTLAVTVVPHLTSFIDGMSFLIRNVFGSTNKMEQLHAEFVRLDGVIEDLKTDIADAKGEGPFGAFSKWMAEQAGVNVPALEQALRNAQAAQEALMVGMGNLMTSPAAQTLTNPPTVPPGGGAAGASGGAASTAVGAGAAGGSFRGAQEVGLEESPAVKALMAEHAYLEQLKAQQAAEATQADIARQAENFELLSMNRFELLDTQLARELEWIATARETKMETEAYYDELERQAVERNEQAKVDLKRQAAQEALSLAEQLGANLFGTSKKWFKAQKVISAAQALVNAHEGASRTLATYPWPLAGALAALHWAAGLARVKAIMSTSIGGGSGGGAGPTGGGASMSSSALDNGAAQAQSGASMARTVTINLGDDDGLISKKAVRGLIGLINEQIGDGVRIIGGEVPA